jgi:hypothetical protein
MAYFSLNVYQFLPSKSYNYKLWKSSPDVNSEPGLCHSASVMVMQYSSGDYNSAISRSGLKHWISGDIPEALPLVRHRHNITVNHQSSTQELWEVARQQPEAFQKALDQLIKRTFFRDLYSEMPTTTALDESVLTMPSGDSFQRKSPKTHLEKQQGILMQTLSDTLTQGRFTVDPYTIDPDMLTFRFEHLLKPSESPLEELEPPAV